MPIVKTIKDDLIEMFKEYRFDEIIHGCNCFHAMGSGIAAQVADEFPEAVTEDRRTKHGDRHKLGTYSLADTKFGWVNNMYTQFYPGRVRDPQNLYDAIRAGFSTWNRYMKEYGDEWRVGIPLIGAGIAGGDWDIIKAVINEAAPDMQITVVEFKKRNSPLLLHTMGI